MILLIPWPQLHLSIYWGHDVRYNHSRQPSSWVWTTYDEGCHFIIYQF